MGETAGFVLLFLVCLFVLTVVPLLVALSSQARSDGERRRGVRGFCGHAHPTAGCVLCGGV